jgi:hypothetical protein
MHHRRCRVHPRPHSLPLGTQRGSGRQGRIRLNLPVLERMGYATGIDPYALLDAADLTGRES